MPELTTDQQTAVLNEIFSTTVQIGHQMAIVAAVLAMRDFEPIVKTKETSRVTERDNKGRIIAVEKTPARKLRKNPDVHVRRRMQKLAHDAGDHPYLEVFAPVWRSKAWARAKVLAASPDLPTWLAHCDRWLHTQEGDHLHDRLNRACTNIAHTAWSRGQVARAQG